MRYRLPRGNTRSIKEFALLWLRRRVAFNDFWALRRVSLRVRPGERLGVIGRNGAGKSTLLQVIARIATPTEGSARVRGRVAPLLQLGAGFDLELSGRENIALNGALLGIRKADLARLFSSIVEFSELDAFIDAPLRTYSSGMAARLGFAMATAVRPDILLLDEVLAVGDEAFQEKCLERIRDYTSTGTTMVLVTHDAALIRQECDRAVWLDGGRMLADGPPDEVLNAYRAWIRPTHGRPEQAAESSVVSG